MDIYCSDLILEVTRRCNMNCAHCIRGEAENADITFDTIKAVLDEVQSIGCISFTGGEPTLNIPAMRYTLDYCIAHSISVYGFYIVTNGKEVSSDFLRLCVDWYAYCVGCGSDDDMCGIALSKDAFHEKIPYNNELMLRAFSFFREDKFTDWNKIQLQNLGRARSLQNYKKREPNRYPLSIEADDDVIRVESNILITVNGDVLPDCDYEYSEAKDMAIGSVKENSLAEIFCSVAECV